MPLPAATAARRPAEVLRVLVLQDLAGEVATAHGHHHFPCPVLGEHVEAAQHDEALVDDDDLLVHVVDLDDSRDDRAEFCQAIGESLLLLQGVAGIPDEDRDADAPGHRLLQRGEDGPDPPGHPGGPQPDGVACFGEAGGEGLIERALVVDGGDLHVASEDVGQPGAEGTEVGGDVGGW